MAFNPMDFRTLGDTVLPFGLRNAKDVTFICIKANGDIIWGRTRRGKDAIVDELTTEDILLWPWVGQYHTDIFRLTKEDVYKYYA